MRKEKDGKKRKRTGTNNQRGFTLVEMLIAMAVFAIVMASVYTVMSVGLKARDSHNVEVQQNARAALDAITSQLRSAIVIPTDATYALVGNTSSVSFYILPPGAGMPQKIEYYIGDNGPASCAGLCRKVYRDPQNPAALPPPEEPVAPAVKKLEMWYSPDGGANWQPSWNSPSALPSIVRIVVESKIDKEANSFETAVELPLSTIPATAAAR